MDTEPSITPPQLGAALHQALRKLALIENAIIALKHTQCGGHAARVTYLYRETSGAILCRTGLAVVWPISCGLCGALGHVATMLGFPVITITLAVVDL